MKKSIDWNVDIGGGGAVFESVTADSENTDTDNVLPANLKVGNHRVKHQFFLNRTEVANASQVGAGELMNLFQAHVSRGLNHIVRKINEYMWIGDGTPNSGAMVGFDAVVANPTLSYADITLAQAPDWLPIVLDNAGTERPLTRQLFHRLDKMVRVKESAYDMIFMNPEMGERYQNLWDDLAGILSVNGQLGGLRDENGFMRSDVGMVRRYYNGIPIIEDPHCPDGKIYFLYSPEVSVYGFAPSIQIGSDGHGASLNNSLGIPVKIATLPSSNSDAVKFEFAAYPQCRVFTRKYLSVITDLPVS